MGTHVNDVATHDPIVGTHVHNMESNDCDESMISIICFFIIWVPMFIMWVPMFIIWKPLIVM